MGVPFDWRLTYNYNTGGGFVGITDLRGVCPHCRVATTFQVRAIVSDRENDKTRFFLILLCQYAPCGKTVYVETSGRYAPGQVSSSASDPFFIYPPRGVEPPHPSVPTDVASDWLEAQRSLQGGNPKASAVMLRRVLYGVLIDKNCKLHPLRDGMQDLISQQRLPAVFDDWLPAIRDDGHDGAHPDRALVVSTENVSETMEYTAELLRYLYVEPYEFQQRKARKVSSVPEPPA